MCSFIQRGEILLDHFPPIDSEGLDEVPRMPEMQVDGQLTAEGLSSVCTERFSVNFELLDTLK